MMDNYWYNVLQKQMQNIGQQELKVFKVDLSVQWNGPFNLMRQIVL